ncbi:hypothetical protein M9H77_02548 [Catharanthus roseus]|uniref:Uncharacterized protein n=1 Tax=Catharanthus roseus TaxID=4058 RepID=A0ACC0C8S1_CATRO|nr:hypothetical protein M9H77_02548 [Catharanthus roseus]
MRVLWKIKRDIKKSNKKEIVANEKRVNHHTFSFLENNSYAFDGSLIPLLGDHCVKIQEEIVEHFQYVFTSLDTYVKHLVEQILVDKPLTVVNGLLEHLWHGHKLLFVEISFKTLFERAYGSEFFLVYYKEFLLLKEFETWMGSYFKMSDTNISEFLESNEASFVLGIEDQRKSGRKGVLLSLANSLISFLTNSSPTYLEFYLEELKLFLNAYAFHEIIVGI